MNNNSQPIKIYTYGKFDAIATYKPVVQQKVTILLDKVDYFFENH